MGVFQSTASAARIFGPIVAGLLYALGTPYPYWLAAGFTAVGALLALQVPGLVAASAVTDAPSAQSAQSD